MKYYKCYTFKNGKLDIDYTDYLVLPLFFERRVNSELQTGEIILEMMPISSKELFQPKTKFRIFRYKNSDFSDANPRVYDYVVDHDDVEEFVGVPDKCTHRIHLKDPAAVTQGMHIDNIALTYELQNATLKYRTTQVSSSPTNVNYNKNGYGYSKAINNKNLEESYQDKYTFANYKNEGWFTHSYRYVWDEDSLQTIKNLLDRYNSAQANQISFEVPKLYCQGSYNGESWTTLFEMPIKVTIVRHKVYQGNTLNEKKDILTFYSGPTVLNSANNDLFYCDGNSAYLRTLRSFVWSDEHPKEPFKDEDVSKPYLELMYSIGSAISTKNSNYSNKIVSFKTEQLSDDEIENGYGYEYVIELTANPTNQSGMFQYINYYVSMTSTMYYNSYNNGKPVVNAYTDKKFNCTSYNVLLDKVDVNLLTFVNCVNMYSDTTFQPFILKGKKYSCYQLFRKAMLTVDTQIIDNEELGLDEIEYFIKIDDAWESRLKTKKVYETTLECKNLWEVFQQLGYYLHAVPRLKFADDETDKFILTFDQLGGKRKRKDTSTKITIYNSQNLDNYFTQLDCYVTNIFSPQNLVEEWLVCTTDDTSALISNNTSILKTKYGISEIVEFEIIYNGKTQSAIEHIFENSIYQVLTSDYRISPGMGDSLRYSLGNNVIDGLNYVPPSENGDMPMALKRIVGKLFENVDIKSLKFNDLLFHIKYRTQDSMRFSQIRPNIDEFMKNSSLEKYPHYEQFYNPQDKIVDSERLSLNLYGNLIRNGNVIVQRQEVVNDDEKEAGDLVDIDGENYYVTICEDEEYNDKTFQKITYSKNYNQLSPIVTIPSEPRFYEVSERSMIRRETRQFEFLKLSDKPNPNPKAPRYLNQSTWKDFIEKLIFNREKVTHPNYAWVRFKADKKRNHTGSNGQIITCDNLFPSSELDRTDANNVVPKNSSDHTDVVVPLLHFPQKDGITYEWDMDDNFKSQDVTDTSISGTQNTADNAYYSKLSTRYCDIMGRADLMNFRLFNKNNWTKSEAQNSQFAGVEPTEEESTAYVPINLAIGLDKDCREAISGNFQITTLYDERFMTYSNMYGEKDSELYCCFLNKEVSEFDENTNTVVAECIEDNVKYNLIDDDENEQITITFEPTANSLDDVESIVFYEIDSDNNRCSYIGFNVKEIINNEIPNLYIYPAFSENKLRS